MRLCICILALAYHMYPPHFATPRPGATPLPPATPHPHPTPQAPYAQQPTFPRTQYQRFRGAEFPIAPPHPTHPPQRHAPYGYFHPQQSYQPLIPKRQLTPMETESHDAMMGHFHPQVNPPEPSVYQKPGDYSTLPAD